MIADELLRWMAQASPSCICGRIIPDGAIYYGFPLSDDADEPCAWINEWHDDCLREWGWRRSDDAWGIEHVTCDTPIEQDLAA